MEQQLVLEKQQRRVAALKDLQRKVSGMNINGNVNRRRRRRTVVTTVPARRRVRLANVSAPNFNANRIPGRLILGPEGNMTTSLLRTNQSLKKLAIPYTDTQTWMRNNYAMCRLNPFHSAGRNLGIPDGSEVRRILIDHRMTTKITFGSTGNVNMFIAPMVPSPLCVQASDANMLINGENFNTNSPSNLLYIPLVLPEWQNKRLVWYATEDKYNEVDTLYSAGKFRLVSLGYRIVYLGTTLNNSGMISVSTTNIAPESPIPNGGTLSVFSSQSGTNTNIGDRQVLQTLLNAPALGGTYANFTSSQTANLSLREGAEGRLMHSGSEFEYTNLHRTMTYMSFSNVDDRSILQQRGPVPTTVGGSGIVAGIDPAWDTHMISVSGGTAGQTFMVDIIACIEYAPQVGSDVYPLAKGAPPKSENILARVENYLKTKPIASTLNSLFGIAKTAAEITTAIL